MEENVVKSAGETLKDQLRHKDGQFSISISGIFRYLKKLCALWIVVSLVVSLLFVSVTAYVKQDTYRKLTALISFTYDGVEKGLDPNGNKFYVNSIKSQEIIEETLEETGIQVDDGEAIRRNITFEGVIPDDAIQRITSYSNVFNGGSSVKSSESIADSTYYPTQYRVHFDYANTGLSDKEAAEFINTMLENYSRHFFDAYGYNQSLGKSLNAFSYEDYDYAEAIDVFDSTLTKLSTYITQVSSADTTRFRSKDTGYTFADLTEAIDTIRELNLNDIDSYVTINSITKDKETLLTYYMYRVEELQRHLSECNETLASVNESIATYQKNTIMYFGDSDEKETNMTASVTSEEYDELFKKRQTIQEDLSKTAQEVNLYNKRIERVNASTQTGSASQKEKAEKEIAELDSKIKLLIEDVSKTTDDFYRTVVFPKAYNVLTPASASTFGVFKHAVKESLFTVLIIDAVIFVIYFCAATILAVRRKCIKLYGSSAKKETEKKSKKKTNEAAEKSKEKKK